MEKNLWNEINGSFGVFVKVLLSYTPSSSHHKLSKSTILTTNCSNIRGKLSLQSQALCEFGKYQNSHSSRKLTSTFVCTEMTFLCIIPFFFLPTAVQLEASQSRKESFSHQQEQLGRAQPNYLSRKTHL